MTGSSDAKDGAILSPIFILFPPSIGFTDESQYVSANVFMNSFRQFPAAHAAKNKLVDVTVPAIPLKLVKNRNIFFFCRITLAAEHSTMAISMKTAAVLPGPGPF